LLRYQGFDGISEAGGGYVRARSEGWWNNDADPKSQYASLEVHNTMVVFPTEHKYFELNTNFSFEKYYDSESQELVEDGNLAEGAFASYSFDVATTGKVAYKYSGTIDAESNSTGYDLKVTVVANATVLESIAEIVNGGDRHQSNGRTASTKMAKAEMQSMK
jgi:hypothetical protein